MAHVYRVKTRDGFVLAQAKTGPRSVAEIRKAMVPEQDAERLTAGQIVQAMRQGVEVIVIDEEPIDEEAQPELPGMDAEASQDPQP